MTTPLSRRALLAGAAASLGAGRAGAHGAAAPRVVAIDWAMLETVLALGVAPVAGSELRQFRLVAAEPEVPATVVDVGLRGTPNFELIRMTAPDHILISSFYEYQRRRLERIAPVRSWSIYAPGRAPYEPAAAAMRDVAALLGSPGAAITYLAEVDAEFAELADRLSGHRRPVLVMNFGDGRHLRIFGPDSMFGETLVRLGLANAWTASTSYSAAAPVALTALARFPDAALVVIPPVPPEVERALPDHAVWNALPAVKAGRVAWLDPVDHFGGVPAARRFARLLAGAVAGGWGRDG